MLKLITYDLNKPHKDYPKLFDGIKSYGNWAHALESVWLVKSNSTAGQIRDHLKQFVDENDQIKVVTVSDWATFNISSEITNWMKN